jgi:peptidoglycan hydrolase-like protein with peptidoglycan-binding domain
VDLTGRGEATAGAGTLAVDCMSPETVQPPAGSERTVTFSQEPGQTPYVAAGEQVSTAEIAATVSAPSLSLSGCTVPVRRASTQAVTICGKAAQHRPGPYPGIQLGPGSPRQLAPMVAAVQEQLNWLKYRCAVVDGVYGPETAGLVRQFQRDHRIPAGGKVGPLTWAAPFPLATRRRRAATW